MTTTYEWHQERVAPFDAAEFYNPGAVVTIRTDDDSVTIERAGAACLGNDKTGVHVDEPDEFRSAFPNGKLPDDGGDWGWNYNGWFECFNAAGDLLDGVDDVAYTLTEALEGALERLEEPA